MKIIYILQLKDLNKFKNLHLAGSALVGVASTVTSSATFNGDETIIPVNPASGNITLTIDSDQKVSGRILIIKRINDENNLYLATEGSEQIQAANVALSDTYQVPNQRYPLQFFCDGSNWYQIN